MDGVLADFNTGFAKLLGLSDVPEITTWNWPQFYGFTDTEIDRAWSRVKESDSFWFELDCINQTAIEVIKETQQEVDYLFLTTRVGNTCREQTVAWLMAHGVKQPEVVVTAKKAEHDVKAMIDDKPENLYPFTQYRGILTGSHVKLYLVDQPWNQWCHSSGLIRVRTATEALYQLGVSA